MHLWSKHKPRKPVIFTLRLQSTVTDVDLGNSGVDAAEEHRLAVGQVVHGVQRYVQPGSGVVDGKYVDGLAVVGRRPAGSALQRTPLADQLFTLSCRPVRESMALLTLGEFQPATASTPPM